jgi:hypothetical protein
MNQKSGYVFVVSVFFALFLSSTIYSQPDTQPPSRLKAQERAKQLKEGALLVRLLSRESSAKKLRDRGLTAQADELLRRQAEKNKIYIDAFLEEYDFSKVYFFSSDDSPQVKSGDLQDVVFLDDNGNPDENISFASDYFLIAEFSKVTGGSAHGVQEYRLEKDSTGVVQKPVYYGGPNLGFSALVLMNDQFEQLEKPFPYYVRYSDGFSLFLKKPKAAVSKMNERLYQTL